MPRIGVCVVAAGVGYDVTVWDPANGDLLASLRGHAHQVNSVDISADGRQAITASLDGSVRVWDLETPRLLTVFTTGGEMLFGASWSHGGSEIAAAGADGDVFIWHVPRESRSPEEVAKIVLCRVPYRMAAGVLQPVTPCVQR